MRGAENRSIDARREAIGLEATARTSVRCCSGIGGRHKRHRWCRPPIQVPVEAEQAAATVALRTKRARLQARVRMSAEMEVLAELSLLCQGECLTPRRH